MNKEFLIKITVAPILLGILFAVFLITFFSLNAQTFSPVYEGAVLSDTVQDTDISAVSDKPLDEAGAGERIGTLKTAKEYPVVFDAPYHMLDEVLSYESGSVPFGESGYVYLRTDRAQLEELQKSISFSVNGTQFDKHDYVLTQTKKFASEEALMRYAPDCGKAVIVFAQDAGNIGIRTTVTGLIFEEVQL